MGNRGVLHDDTGTIVRRQATRSWIICRLEFKGRRRRLLQPGRWTELFFWDEVTALAAGHRPCFECRRQDAVRFRDLFRQVTGEVAAGAPAIDRRLAAERGALGSPPRVGAAVLTAAAARLPEHAIVLHDGLPHVVTEGRLRPWDETGYGAPTAFPTGEVPVITPATTVAVLAAGYQTVMV
ncbi:MAG: hypothetical protein M3349_05450 [Actinomycetota bacterium]|nr:hypothetical protein [Actinomycetota bacterium]